MLFGLVGEHLIRFLRLKTLKNVKTKSYFIFCFPASVGLSFLQFTNMNSMRNLFIVGVSFFLGLSIPEYFREYTAGALHGPSHRKAECVSWSLYVYFEGLFT